MGKSLLSSRFCVSAHWLFLSVRHSLLSLVQSQQLDSVLAIPTVAQIAFEDRSVGFTFCFPSDPKHETRIESAKIASNDKILNSSPQGTQVHVCILEIISSQVQCRPLCG
eukprot:m.604692 g.604692  ORF g.604692 m.604692 type:complete len:110 (-) comp58107_c0_seq24:2398-2727(-)